MSVDIEPFATDVSPSSNGADEPEPAPPFSDEALALEFAERHKDELRYVGAARKWFRWTGERWEADDTLHVWDMARALCREVAGSAKKHEPKRIASATTVAAVEKLARADRLLAARDNWDPDPDLFNTPMMKERDE